MATCSATDLLRSDGVELTQGDKNTALRGRLNIPEYQRPYRWQAKEIRRLIADIGEHFDREQTRKDERGEEYSPIPYYLGSVILHRDDNGKLNIIDGQQRITTLAIIAQVTSESPGSNLKYSSPVSQRQILKNLRWLERETIKSINFNQLEFTLVVTDSEDDAYAFFETQNTGGVRLSGPDIIKAHHLRAVAPSTAVNEYARRWEAMGDLKPVVGLLLRGRYWAAVKPRIIPKHNELMAIRTSIVREFAELTGGGKEDTAYVRIARTRHLDGAETVHSPISGYTLRQPLNSGVNSIHYLQFFETLRCRYLVGPDAASASKGDFEYFYQNLVFRLRGCGYLKQLYDACLLMYISQFGEQQLCKAAARIFRVVYSRRVENHRAVREQSVAAFVRDTPVLDWITLSYTPEQCFSYFDEFELAVSPDGLETGKSGVKMQFVCAIAEYFQFDLPTLKEGDERVDANKFASEFTEKVLNYG